MILIFHISVIETTSKNMRLVQNLSDSSISFDLFLGAKLACRYIIVVLLTRINLAIRSMCIGSLGKIAVSDHKQDKKK